MTVAVTSVHVPKNVSMWTDGHDEGNSRFSQFCEKRLKTIKLTLDWKLIAVFFAENNKNKINTQ
jgi:hypothetical protein